MRRLERHSKRLAMLVASGLLAGCGVVGEVGSDRDEEPLAPELGANIVNPSGVRSAASAAATKPCGAVLATFDGTRAYSNGNASGTGTSCAGLGTYGYRYQCVELTTRHFKRKWNIMLYGDAKDLMDKASADVAVYNNGDTQNPPVPGDILVWTNGSVGHAALIVGVRPDAVDIIEQNVAGTDGKDTLTYSNGRVGRHLGWTPAGWVHAVANHAAPAVQPAPPEPASCHVGDVFGYDYCSEDCPCDVGEGDCDTSRDCKPGLYCGQDIGARYGANADVDVCLPRPTSTCHLGKVFDYEYCSEACPCDAGQGDCDNSNQCKPGLYCGKDIGARYGAAADVDVCIPRP
ncbi:MAG: CHAP domain-containing protein [Myxococcales bacterium]|nr:CHAP domain-containing protein [Myxococcales bacterium]